jgi:hypothetical protein
MALDAVAEEVLEEFDAFARLTQVKCDEGVRQKVQAVGARLRDEAVLDWEELEVLESVRAILRLCRTHHLGVVWKDST